MRQTASWLLAASTLLVYATANDLLRRASAQELAEASAQDAHVVDGPLLVRALAAGDDIDTDLAEVPTAARAAVKAAIAVIHAEIHDAGAVVDGYLGPDTVLSADTLRAYTVDIALWQLLGGAEAGAVYLSYKHTINWLTRLSTSSTAHGDPTTGAADTASGARVTGAMPRFTRSGLAGTMDDY